VSIFTDLQHIELWAEQEGLKIRAACGNTDLLPWERFAAELLPALAELGIRADGTQPATDTPADPTAEPVTDTPADPTAEPVTDTPGN
jgi:hypothetical protein